jgi:hypothetical protein
VRKTHRRALVATGFLLLLGLSACGSDPKQPAVATAQSQGAASPKSSANAVTQYVDAQRKWVGCLRQEGYNVPDPDAKGHVDLAAFFASAKLKKTDPGFLAAQKKCASLQTELPAELEPSQPPLTAEQLENRRKYSQCMRANGMPNWPDPDAKGDYPQDALGGELTKEQQEANIRALQICEPVLDGKPPTTPNPSQVAQG